MQQLADPEDVAEVTMQPLRCDPPQRRVYRPPIASPATRWPALQLHDVCGRLPTPPAFAHADVWRQFLSNTMYALGRFGRVPPCGLLRRLAAAVARDATRYAPEELSGAIWALGALGEKPGAAWHAAFDAAAAARLAQPGFGARAASVVLLSLARLEHHPGRVALGGYSAELLRCAAQRRAGAQALANSLFAFASLHNLLRDRWQAAQDAERDANGGDARSASMPRAAESLPRGDGDAGNPLSFPLPDALDALCAAAAPLLPGCKAQELSQILWALGVLGHDPGPAWRAAFCVAACGADAAAGGARLGPGLRRFGPRELGALLQSHAHLGVAPPPAFLDAWAAAAAPQWPAFEARHAVHAAWALTAVDAPRRCASGASALNAAWTRLAAACAEAEAAGIAAEALMPTAGWAQAGQAALVCAGTDGPDPLAALPVACRSACTAALRRNARRGAASAMQRDVAAALFSGLGVTAELEASVAGGAASVDIALEAHALRGLPGVPQRRVALEVDGPCHDVRCGGRRRRAGGTAMRSRALAALGWRPLVLRHDAWPRGFDARVEALHRLLRGADDDGALEASTDAELAPALQAALRRR